MKGTRGEKILVLFCSLFLFPRWLSGWMITALLTRRDVLSWCRPFSAGVRFGIIKRPIYAEPPILFAVLGRVVAVAVAVAGDFAYLL